MISILIPALTLTNYYLQHAAHASCHGVPTSLLGRAGKSDGTHCCICIIYIYIKTSHLASRYGINPTVYFTTQLVP